jgi:phosphate starvation-inducible PhoH-like protein
LDGKESGLVHATKVLDGVEGIAVCRLTAKDVVSHPLVMRIIRAYEKDAEKLEKKTDGEQENPSKKNGKRRVKDAEGE